MSDKLEDLKRFIYDTLLEWTDFDPDGQISFLIDSRFSETERAIQSYIDSKIIEELTKLLDAEIIKPEYHNLIVGKIMELKNNG